MQAALHGVKNPLLLGIKAIAIMACQAPTMASLHTVVADCSEWRRGRSPDGGETRPSAMLTTSAVPKTRAERLRLAALLLLESVLVLAVALRPACPASLCYLVLALALGPTPLAALTVLPCSLAAIAAAVAAEPNVSAALLSAEADLFALIAASGALLVEAAAGGLRGRVISALRRCDTPCGPAGPPPVRPPALVAAAAVAALSPSLLAAPLLVSGTRALTTRHAVGFDSGERSASAPAGGTRGRAAWPLLRAYVLFWAVGWYCAHLVPWMGGAGAVGTPAHGESGAASAEDTAGGGISFAKPSGDTGRGASPLATLLGIPFLHDLVPAHIRPTAASAAVTAGAAGLEAAAREGAVGAPPALGGVWAAPAAGDAAELVIAAQAAALLLLGVWLAIPKYSLGSKHSPSTPNSSDSPGASEAKYSPGAPDPSSSLRQSGMLVRVSVALCGWPGAELCAAAVGCLQLVWVLAVPSLPSLLLFAVGLGALLAAPAWPWRGQGCKQPAPVRGARAAAGKGRCRSRQSDAAGPPEYTAGGEGGPVKCTAGGDGGSPECTAGGRFAGLPPPGRRPLPAGHLPFPCGQPAGAPPGTLPASRWVQGCLVFGAAWLMTAYTTVAAWRYLHVAGAEFPVAALSVSAPAEGTAAGGWAAASERWARAGRVHGSIGSAGYNGTMAASTHPHSSVHASLVRLGLLPRLYFYPGPWLAGWAPVGAGTSEAVMLLAMLGLLAAAAVANAVHWAVEEAAAAPTEQDESMMLAQSSAHARAAPSAVVGSSALPLAGVRNTATRISASTAAPSAFCAAPPPPPASSAPTPLRAAPSFSAVSAAPAQLGMAAVTLLGGASVAEAALALAQDSANAASAAPRALRIAASSAAAAGLWHSRYLSLFGLLLAAAAPASEAGMAHVAWLVLFCWAGSIETSQARCGRPLPTVYDPLSPSAAARLPFRFCERPPSSPPTLLQRLACVLS